MLIPCRFPWRQGATSLPNEERASVRLNACAKSQRWSELMHACHTDLSIPTVSFALECDSNCCILKVGV